jgi:hypothetical protein
VVTEPRQLDPVAEGSPRSHTRTSPAGGPNPNTPTLDTPRRTRNLRRYRRYPGLTAYTGCAGFDFPPFDCRWGHPRPTPVRSGRPAQAPAKWRTTRGASRPAPAPPAPRHSGTRPGCPRREPSKTLEPSRMSGGSQRRPGVEIGSQNGAPGRRQRCEPGIASTAGIERLVRDRAGPSWLDCRIGSGAAVELWRVAAQPVKDFSGTQVSQDMARFSFMRVVRSASRRSRSKR